MRFGLSSMVFLGLFGCTEETAVEADTSPDGDGSAETSVEPGDASDEASPADEVTASGAPALLGERGFTEVRLIAHLHSAFSHDGCDDQGLDAEGRPNLDCVRRMKRALCGERIAHAFMTDHPDSMRDQAWADLFYADAPADDRLLLAEDGTPWAVRFACDAGEGGPDGRVTLMVGFEGTHTMPLGLRRHLAADRYATFADDTPTDVLAALTAGVAEAGGKVAIAHSEDDDLSAATIAAHDVAAMELYNFHANFQEVLGGGLGEALFTLEGFLDLDAAVPDPDLTALIMLATYPEAALHKWRAVAAVRPITAFAGSDVHENVSFAPACKDTDACDGIARLYPNLVDYLRVGGPVWQADGERIDGYARIFRWVQNRVFLPAGDDPADPSAVERAFFAGRVQVTFEVLGEARGVALVAETPGGALHDLGATLAPSSGATLWARSPDLPVPPRFAAWTDGGAAVMESIVWRTDATGSHEVARWSGPGTWRQIPLDDPGAYQLEVLLTPHHLAAQLGPAAELATRTYRWVETNAIRLEP